MDFNKFPTDALLFRAAPDAVMRLMRRYFRLKVFGSHHLPRSGGAIVAANHSGFFGLDALILTHEIKRAVGRLPRTLAHEFWYRNSQLSYVFKKLGFVKASMRNGHMVLDRQQMMLIFPEGERGNFKPSLKAYQLQNFRSGFIRLAIAHNVPIIPTVVLGAEESQLNLSRIRLPMGFNKLMLPLPLIPFPLPAKWEIHFLPPVHLPYSSKMDLNDELLNELTVDFKEQMQLHIAQLLKSRTSVFW